MRVEQDTPRAVVDQSQHAAEAAARHAGVTTTDDLSMDDLRAAAALFSHVWKTGDESQVSSELMRALSHAGNYVSAAFDNDGRLVGASVAFLTASDGELGLHSHITGVLPDAQGRSVGFALKQHQRAWSLEHGITVARWTYDPLVRRNGFFNIAKLGAEATEFLPNFYGSMSDGINAGDDSDRCLITWTLASERAITASEGGTLDADVDALRADGVRVVLDEDASGAPVPGPQSGPVRLCRVPPDAVELRASDPGRAREWRVALRDAFSHAFADGLQATGFARSGWYVLERPA